jgi:hypothetical protein
MGFSKRWLIFLAMTTAVTAADFAQFAGKILWLDNGAVRRGGVVSDRGNLSTLTFRLPNYGNNFVAIEGEEPAGALS